LDLAWNKPEHKPEVAAAIKELLSVNTSICYFAVPRIYKTMEIKNKMNASRSLKKSRNNLLVLMKPVKNLLILDQVTAQK